ncbi:MliC family protein [Aliiruegeria lutimaris]|uniref:Membrane-bound lysozyme-inhibitor of c-type lysozyme n=1 Tax=Aliiruegeria lutimaris TaxID=571298 RepID=A0A1G8TJF3_9RHOB|nr:MliC family protein [Aliiruegeria lutimaris]SDJ41726.1 Membrane-bound lysozyme-inhibitor of c-type lysozyme [Aliiruegeria lutimaris]
MRAISLFFSTLLACGPSWAADGPSFDCSAATSETETLICGDARLSELDRRLAARFSAAMEAARGLDAGAAGAEDALRGFQRGWIKGRDECWKAQDSRACIEESYLTREGVLVATWMLEPPRGTDFWSCGGSPANEVVTTYFDTELPSVRFERGDSVDAGSLVRTASGSKYEGSFGRSIWIKGEEATYREPDPDGKSYECRLASSR